MQASQATVSTPDFSSWLPKKKVADILNVSTKTIEKYHADGKIEGVSWSRPSGVPIMVYPPEDVERLRKAREYVPVVLAAVPAPAGAKGESLSPQSSLASQDSGGWPEAEMRRALGLLLSVLQGLAVNPKLLLPVGAKGENASHEASQPSQVAAPKPAKPQVEVRDRVYLTVPEAALYLGWPERQVRAAIAGGVLPARREGHTRVRRRDLDAL